MVTRRRITRVNNQGKISTWTTETDVDDGKGADGVLLLFAFVFFPFLPAFFVSHLVWVFLAKTVHVVFAVGATAAVAVALGWAIVMFFRHANWLLIGLYGFAMASGIAGYMAQGYYPGDPIMVVGIAILAGAVGAGCCMISAKVIRPKPAKLKTRQRGVISAPGAVLSSDDRIEPTF